MQKRPVIFFMYLSASVGFYSSRDRQFDGRLPQQFDDIEIIDDEQAAGRLLNNNLTLLNGTELRHRVEGQLKNTFRSRIFRKEGIPCGNPTRKIPSNFGKHYYNKIERSIFSNRA